MRYKGEKNSYFLPCIVIGENNQVPEEMHAYIILSTFFVVLVCMCIMRFWLITATVISQSMAPTLEIGNRVLALRYWPICWLRKGQIVLFWPPEGYPIPQYEPYDRMPLIKRVVGLPGDTLAGGQGKDIASPSKTQIVPPDHFAIQGDLFAEDGYSSHQGFVPSANFLALVIMKLPRRDPQAQNMPDEH